MTTDANGSQGITSAPTAAPRSSSVAALRWLLLRRFLFSTSSKGLAAEAELSKVSRRPVGRYNLVPSRVQNAAEREAEADCPDADVMVEYMLPVSDNIMLTMRQRSDGYINFHDFAICQRNSIDNTGIVCLWPAEEVLTYFCGKHPEIFRNKIVIELGSGYGLGGLAIAACTEATEVVITDGNPQVLDYIEQNISANACTFGNTSVSSSYLHWSRDHIPLSGKNFDLVVAADCTFFEDFHVDLAYTIKSLLGTSKGSEAILFNPRRGKTLDLFVHAAKSHGLIVEMKEQYDAHVWDIHQQFLRGDQAGWPNYDSNHCYPLFLSVKSSGGYLCSHVTLGST